MERLEQVVALIVAAGLAVVSYQLFSPARRDDRPSREITEKTAAHTSGPALCQAMSRGGVKKLHS